MSTVSLSQLKPGSRALIIELIDQRMMEMGMTVGSEIELAYEAPFGGAIAVRCRGALIALRISDARSVRVKAL